MFSARSSVSTRAAVEAFLRVVLDRVAKVLPARVKRDSALLADRGQHF
jgi:hypothetical protein